MTSTTFFDAPGGIRREGNDQTLTFTRTSPTAGTLCWTPVPPGGAGCGTPSGHYTGGVLVGSTSPITQNEKPLDGTCCYNGDPTMSQQLFAGDTIGNAKVLWSNNTDKTTGCVDVTGLDSNCVAYYFAFFAIDNTCRYNQDGIFSYSLTLATTSIECTSGSQCLQTNGIRTTDYLTLLTPGGDGIDPATKTYPVQLMLDGKKMDLVLRGSHLSTYQSLVDELGTAWQRLGPAALELANPPHYGEFVYQAGVWSQFDGENSRQIFPLLTPTDPHAPTIGTTWLNTLTSVLSTWNGSAWIPASPVIKYPQDPSVVSCDQLWYDGTKVYKFDGVTWIEQTLAQTLIDPSLAPVLTCTSFWKNGTVISRWSDVTQHWNQVQATYFPSDPLSLPNGTYWYNPLTLTIQMWNGLIWANQVFINSTTVPVEPPTNTLWFNPATNTLSKFDGVTFTWVNIPVVVAVKPLNSIQIGELWFDTALNLLKEYTSTGWVDVTSTTYFTAMDPSLPPVISEGSVWYNGTLWFVRSGTQWVGVNVINSAVDPRNLTTGFWVNPTTNSWYSRSGPIWVLIIPSFSLGYDPTIPQLGATWFDGTQLHQQTTLTAWAVVPFSVTPVIIPVGQRWLNTTTGEMSIWSGSKWVIQPVPYTVAFTTINDIQLASATCGEPSYIEVLNSQLLFSILKLVPAMPIAGLDSKSGTPMYSEVGVGTDGSADDRRAVIDNLYTRLGHPLIDVGLTRAHMDLAVQKGLDYIRRDSGAGYTRGYFFLTLNPGQQQYTLTSKAVGFNKIVDVLYVYRPRGGFLNSTFGGEIYGQQMLQQLYVSGTFDILTYHLLANYQSIVAKLFASDFQFQWSERTRVLAIQRKIGRQERVLIDAVIERTEQDLFTDRMTKNWIENWALSEAKIMLGETRGKYQSLPGAGGSVSLNAADLKNEAIAMQQVLRQELDDLVVSEIETWGIGASITRG